MQYSFVTKTGSNGLSIIDRDKSFMALIDLLEPIYKEIFDDDPEYYGKMISALDDFPDFMEDLIRRNEKTSDADEILTDEEAIYTLMFCYVFKLVDSEHRDVKLAVEILENVEKIHPCADVFLILGILHCCAPNGMIQNKKLALSLLQKAGNPENIILSDEEEVKSSIESAIEVVSVSESSTKNALTKIDVTANKAVAATPTEKSVTIKDVNEKKEGIWAVVINVALKALSKFSADKLNDPIFMRKALGKAYELLPFWVRMVVSEDLFFNFCFDRRVLLINKVASGQLSITNDEGECYLPKDDEQPKISKETILVNIVDRHSGNLFSEERFYFFPNTASENFKNAYDSYVKEALERVGLSTSGGHGVLNRALKSMGIVNDGIPDGVGTPLFMYDSTAFSSCKTGFIITTEMFIVKEMMNKPTLIKISHIDKFEMKKSFLSAGKIYINNECIIDCNQGKKESFQKFSLMFSEIINSY